MIEVVTLITAVVEFQSAPLTDVRGDNAKNGSNNYEFLFQSAPLTDVRGD